MKSLRHAASLLSLFAFSVGATGCATAYTSIQKVNENTYLVTKQRTGLGTQGSLLMCTPSGMSLHCTEVDAP